jgi:D-amino-acid dehydrogenase
LRAAGLDFEMHATGLTFVALSEHELAKYSHAFDEFRALGYTGETEILTAAEARSLEPALTTATAGALRVVEDRHLRPDSFTRALRTACAESGVTVLERTPVLRLERRGERVALRTADARLEPQAVVVAAGVWTRPLLSTLGITVPIESAKGYSITVPGEAPVGRALYLAEGRIGVTPFAGSTRVAGMLELTGIDSSLDSRRLESLVATTRRYLPTWSGLHAAGGWSGLRPLAPDGLPVIGRCSPFQNLYVASGHGMVGITLAPVTADALAPVVLNGATNDDLAPFTPDRFMHTNRRRSGSQRGRGNDRGVIRYPPEGA